ncbi:putative cobalt transporter CbtA [Motilibacter peucedani]|uniref:Putative cobalt transporter CbtA n=1 Tax=Motilibacter peucedani TaxID=598650 RepID=A0A420XNJ3_9ACTN|nr:CbtA family protein [Motilibacter peucedani]RKS73773.1 putative cobalt transporter CbtA [Motilibacter peucedani]
MARTLLVRGMLVGLVAGVLAFLVARLLGEAQVAHAIAFESAREAAEGAAPEEELVSRTVQSTLGLLTATTVFSVGLGGVYALAYALVQGRLGRLGARATAALTALGGFLAVYALPALKYPANPPAIGRADTIGSRTAYYLAMVLLSFAVVVSVAVAGRALVGRLGTWNAWTVAVAGGVVAVGVCYAAMPGVHETPAGFPADVLWRFRLASWAVSLTVWATFGLLFGALTERALAEHPSRRRARGTSAAARSSLA